MKIVEIGAGDYRSCYIKDIIRNGDEAIIFEPNCFFYKDLVLSFRNMKNVVVYNFALAEHDKGDIFYNYGYFSFLKGAYSFTQLQVDGNGNMCSPEPWIKELSTFVPTVRMDQVDDGNIDFLNLTNVGSEMSVLSNMKSRPNIIRTIYYCHNHYQSNYYGRISSWMMENGYRASNIQKNSVATYFEVMFSKDTNA